MRAAPRRAAALSLAGALLVGACATHPRVPPRSPADEGATIAGVAAALVGRPYQFGGADAAGFDCSGLARYVYERVGVAIPRTAAAQQRAAHPVPLAQLAPGDLLFFSIGARGVDHVGIYAGAGRFIHARHAGVAVAYANLSEGFYARHLRGAGRFW
jgi:cell wall-associated NlpC family hydrolase